MPAGSAITGPMALTPDTLKARRQALGLSQDALAAALGMTGGDRARTVRRWELGERKIPPWLELALTAVERGIDPQ